MNEQTVKLIEKLAQKLGTTTEFLWEVLLRQALISGIIYVIMIPVAFLMIIPYTKYFKWVTKNQDELYDNDTDLAHHVALIVSGTMLFVFIVVSVFSIETTITALINPEYWALKEILDSIK